ncbi:hypothetical protein GP5015_2390 [gamma proteobacterium HTCC5015]|nr:hypothetical protein GP5015_2390 [gamma proteobacterium HTCC5015]
MHLNQGHYQKITRERVIEMAHRNRDILGYDRKAPMLIYGNNILGLDYQAARESTHSPFADHCLCMAAVVQTRLEEYLSHLYEIHRPPFPFKAFRNQEAAIVWLNKKCKELGQPL